jgi:mannose-6-phosphate isomerase-like protein (cupin superfamily)
VRAFTFTILVLAVGASAAAAQTFTDNTFSENNGPKQATYIADEEVKTVLKGAPPAVDQQIKVVDTGKYNVGVGIIHRGKIPPRSDGAVDGIIHHNQTETYVIVSGTGTLATGGTIQGGKEYAPDSAVYKVLNGPSLSGTVKTGFYLRVVKPGDLVIIPPDVFHGWAQVDDHVDYLSVRPDPDRVLPAGYVIPAIKK